ncbi:RNA-binding protein 34 isoform X2 [Hoplias malabaricus]|uniref:RNA-binding protein 34 isoform X2 n=1 Tax=Hoplias malabaricus TaxID=27720 RepID=UPI003461CBAB
MTEPGKGARKSQKKMKKRAKPSEEAVGNAGEGYVIGLVSGSLGSKTTPSSGTLSSLFSTASSNTLVFVPAQKVEVKGSQMKHEPEQVQSSKEPSQQKTTTKERSAAEEKLHCREKALKNADDEDDVKSPKKVKRKAPEKDFDGEDLDERSGKKQRIQRNMAEERIKLKRTVFVGNLPLNYQKKHVKRVFKDLGAIESVRFRSVVQEDPTMSRRLATIQRQVDSKQDSINAYVVFKEEEGAVNALQRNGMEIEKDHYIRVDRASKNLTHEHKRSIFVGNLPYDLKELPLRQHFEECGKVEAVRLVRDRNSGVGKGFGYVLFENTDSVMLALKMNGSLLLDRKIRVKRSVKKEKVKNDRGPPGKSAKGQNRNDGGKKTGPKPGRFKGSKRPEGNKPAGKTFKKSLGAGSKSTSFKGEMADPNSKKGLKKRFKPKKKK